MSTLIDAWAWSETIMMGTFFVVLVISLCVVRAASLWAAFVVVRAFWRKRREPSGGETTTTKWPEDYDTIARMVARNGRERKTDASN